MPFDKEVLNSRDNKVTEKVIEKEVAILRLIESNAHITTQELAKELDCTRKTISVYIKALKEKGLIERVGSDKAGYWKVL